MDYKKKYESWLKSSYLKNKDREELENIYYIEEEIKNRFSKNLSFGTGGVRGLIGLGTNRINIYTIRMITQGFANFLLNNDNVELNVKKRGIAIAYDSRNMSKDLAIETALVFNGNGIKTFIFSEEKSTPELSFAVRFLKCAGGVVITASHNSCKYNGYKAYNEEGCQFYKPKDTELMKYIDKVNNFNHIKRIDLDESKKIRLYNFIDNNVEEKFSEYLLKESIEINNLKKESKNLKIVYSPLHGTGYKPINKILKKAGFLKFYTVEEQKLPDGNFPTIKYPNPECEESFDLAINLAKKVNGDIVILTDTDTDRVGMAIKTKKDTYKILKGNIIGTIILEYLLEEKSKNKTLKENHVIVSSLVSTKIIKEMAKYYKIKHFEIFTGFKYVGKLIKKFEEENSHEFLFAFEESGGYLIGKNTRDKDGIVTTLLLCEIAAYLKEKNLSIEDFLEKIYEKYGYYEETTDCIILEEENYKEKFEKIMTKLRKENIINNESLNSKNLKIEKIIDYKKSIIIDFKTKKETALKEEKADILYYNLQENIWFCIRQSGTEPKLKLYFGAKDKDKIKSYEKLENCRKYIKNIILEELKLLN